MEVRVTFTLERSASTTDLATVDDEIRIGEIETGLKQLEQRISGIEMRIQEDLEAEQIGIPFPIADIIDYITALKVVMYKRHLLTHQLHAIVQSDKQQYAEETKTMTKEYAVLNKLAMLEDALIRLEHLPLVHDDELNKYYPLLNDLTFLKRVIARFLDKYEV
ncbi:unnamed protein product [Gongylonema pulchrum]|uniref:Dynactin domain-containing protein n=1 Tax=Gongylonema pulchrum TaxID=637853 RepID=A0A3P7PEK1_9BILA|nr:unnamed protein product [Gongylonema pulchrum]